MPTKPLTRIRALLRATRKRLANENGNVLIIVVIALPVLMAAAAFAIDVANVWAARQHIQSVADAAALAGAQELDGSGSTTNYTSANHYVTTYVGLNTAANSATYTSTPSGYDMTVTVTQKVPMFFSGVFGLHEATVHATSTAQNNPTSSTSTGDSDLSTLEKAGVADATMVNGNSISDGWYNFCAAADSTTGDMSEPGRCPSTGSYSVLPTTTQPPTSTDPQFNVIYGGVDVSTNTGQYVDSTGKSYPMIDLTGTCVEAKGSFPSPHNGSTTFAADDPNTGTLKGSYDGYCANNADGEIEALYSTPVPGSTYTFKFELGANTSGKPTWKPMVVMASGTDFTKSSLPAATTQGTSSNSYGTSYPLFSQNHNGAIPGVTYQEYSDNNGKGVFTSESFTFKATSRTTYIALAALTNCEADWNGSASKAAPDSKIAGPFTQNSFTAPGVQTYDEVTTGGSTDCRFGAGVAYDFSLSGPGLGGITLTK